METHPSLADRFAGLRAIPTTPNADTTLLSAALCAMIAAIFARIFGRLEQFLLLWQSGTLPAPQPRATVFRAATAAPRPTPAPRTPIPRRPHDRSTRAPEIRIPQTIPAAAPPRHAPPIHRTAIQATTPRQQPRAPPSAGPAPKSPICRLASAYSFYSDIVTLRSRTPKRQPACPASAPIGRVPPRPENTA